MPAWQDREGRSSLVESNPQALAFAGIPPSFLGCLQAPPWKSSPQADEVQVIQISGVSETWPVLPYGSLQDKRSRIWTGRCEHCTIWW